MSTALKLKPGQSLTNEARTQKVIELRELMANGYMSIDKIATHFNVAYNTASAWRKASLLMIAKDDDGYTRDALRNIQTGRIMYKIEGLETDLKQATDMDTRLKVHDRIVKYYDALARITGLNSETIDHTISAKPLNIVMPSTEGEIVQPSIDVPPRTP
jgi:hypothetical protein